MAFQIKTRAKIQFDCFNMSGAPYEPCGVKRMSNNSRESYNKSRSKELLLGLFLKLLLKVAKFDIANFLFEI